VKKFLKTAQDRGRVAGSSAHAPRHGDFLVNLNVDSVPDARLFPEKAHCPGDGAAFPMKTELTPYRKRILSARGTKDDIIVQRNRLKKRTYLVITVFPPPQDLEVQIHLGGRFDRYFPRHISPKRSENTHGQSRGRPRPLRPSPFLFDRKRSLSYTLSHVENRIFETFLEALRQIFAETGIEIEIAGHDTEDSSDNQVVTSVGITGNVKGNLMLCTDYPSARNIVTSMMGKVRIPFPETGLGEIQRTALGEITNQISGRAVTILSESMMECDITPPVVLTADLLKPHVPDSMRSFSRAVRGPFGNLRLFLAINSMPGEKTS
jgi:chemotaxis protein CheX